MQRKRNWSTPPRNDSHIGIIRIPIYIFRFAKPKTNFLFFIYFVFKWYACARYEFCDVHHPPVDDDNPTTMLVYISCTKIYHELHHNNYTHHILYAFTRVPLFYHLRSFLGRSRPHNAASAVWLKLSRAELLLLAIHAIENEWDVYETGLIWHVRTRAIRDDGTATNLYYTMRYIHAGDINALFVVYCSTYYIYIYMLDVCIPQYV